MKYRPHVKSVFVIACNIQKSHLLSFEYSLDQPRIHERKLEICMYVASNFPAFNNLLY